MQRSGWRVGLVAIILALCLVPLTQASGPSHAWHDLRGTFQDEWKYQDNLTAYGKVLALEPDSAVAWQGKGDALLWFGRYPEALAAYNRSLALDPGSATAWAGKGGTLVLYSRPDEALDAYNRSLALDPGSADAWSGKGLALLRIERYNESLDAYDRAISLDPENPRLWVWKGWSYTWDNRTDEGFAACNHALALDPHYRDAVYCKAILMSFLNYPVEESRAVMYEGLFIDPGYSDGWFGLGYLLKSSGFGPEMRAYDKALVMDPDNTRAWRAKADLYDWVNMTPEAYAAAYRMLEIDPSSESAKYKIGAMNEKYGLDYPLNLTAS